ncbi:unnamed protein product [Danaus chrysippus]|uniref:(African queen) hypothetical protein n=1 Tax=Danaus chrysippus TaxID=151541 RepID=A0A8J2VVS5_9NEOP|nr:unnamed protein product [Danaus chrysippus]
MASPSSTPKAPSPPPGHGPSKMERRMSHFKEYKFFRSFSAKIENWPMRKAEQLWRKMRERKIAASRAVRNINQIND